MPLRLVRNSAGRERRGPDGLLLLKRCRQRRTAKTCEKSTQRTLRRQLTSRQAAAALLLSMEPVAEGIRVGALAGETRGEHGDDLDGADDHLCLEAP